MGRTRVALLVLSALAACQSEPTGPVSVPLADAASLHVIAVPTNDDWTGHIPLTTGHTVRMKLKLLTAAGREITPLVHPLVMSFSFAPSGLANASVADSALLLFDATPIDSAGTEGSMNVTLTEPATGATKSFGPFFVLIHPAF